MVERVGWFWIDENGNKWNARYFSKEEALDYSKSLINCENCINCYDSDNCRKCRDIDFGVGVVNYS